MLRKGIALVIAIAALAFVGPTSAATPSYKSPRLIKMLPHIKERGSIARPALR